MPTQRKNGELNKVLNEISEYLSDISNVENIINYYWRAGIYAEKLLKRKRKIASTCSKSSDVR